MSDLKQARVLVTAAERDISALHGMEDADVFVDEIFGFHGQQASEKLLKAWLALLGETYPTTHDLARLLAMLRARDVEATHFNELVEYTPFAVQFRYALKNALRIGRQGEIRDRSTPRQRIVCRGCLLQQRPRHNRNRPLDA